MSLFPLGKVLVTLCGFGPRTGETSNSNRFENGARLAAYAGLAPTDRRSGRSLNNTSQSRAGNHRLKNAMSLAAFIETQHQPDAKAYYQRKQAQGKKQNAAIIYVAKKCCNLILATLKTQTAYNPERNLQKVA